MSRLGWFAAIFVVAATAALLSVVYLGGRANHDEPLAAFSLVAPTDVAPSQLVARAIVPAGAPCPKVRVSGSDGSASLSMSERIPGPLAARAFTHVRSCSAVLPTGLTSARVGQFTIPAAMPAQARRIGMLADSGCRLDEYRIQDCRSPDGWPLAQIAQRVADAKPDLVVDPGDYIYREIPCPPQAQDKCASPVAPIGGLPFTETDEGWLEEVINPMAPVFAAAPVAMLRGNHEDCGRAGNGFFLFFDPRPGTEQLCEPVRGEEKLEAADETITPTWSFTVPVAQGRSLRLAMVDTANGSDTKLGSWVEDQRARYEEAAAQTAPAQGLESWLITHRPIFSIISRRLLPADDPQADVWSSDGQLAASYGLLGNYSMILSSHNHYVQAVQIPGQPGSLVLGNGGALLEPGLDYEIPPYGPLAKGDGTPLIPGLEPYPTASSLWFRVQYGYAIADVANDPGAWTIGQFAFDGARMGTCALQDKNLNCA